MELLDAKISGILDGHFSIKSSLTCNYNFDKAMKFKESGCRNISVRWKTCSVI